VTDATDYTIPVHGERRRLNHVAIEIRQDLIACSRGCCRKRISESRPSLKP
jgi:predicted N-formylglutamate amidohydrolase